MPLTIRDAAILTDLEMMRGRIHIMPAADASEELSDLTIEQVMMFMKYAVTPEQKPEGNP